MVSGTVLAASLLLAAAEPGAGPDAGASEEVKSALAKGGYPWYEPKTDSAKSLLPSWDWDFDPKINVSLPGEWVGLVVASIGLAALAILLVYLWRQYRQDAGRFVEATAGASGSAHRIEGLPEGLRPDTDDPWAEAVRRRARGDYAGAVVCLFAHQLLALDRLRKVRLVPGRTGRQLVRSIDDPRLRGWVEPTLRLFEAVYYGHRPPSAEAFEAVWALAEDFERHLAAGASA